jgi:putative ABC transport system permease protein
MLGHYLLVAVRSMRRAPTLSAINILTLTLGLVCFLAAYGIVGFWDRAEAHFANAPRIYVVTTSVAPTGSDTRSGQSPLSNSSVAQYLRADFPAIDAIARARVASAAELVAADDRAMTLFDVSVDPSFLAIFNLPFLDGDSRNSLSQPRSAVLTKGCCDSRVWDSQSPRNRGTQSSLPVEGPARAPTARADRAYSTNPSTIRL